MQANSFKPNFASRQTC